MKRQGKITRIGTGVRVNLKNLADYRILASGLKKIALSRLLHDLIVEAGLGLANAKVPGVEENGTISTIQRQEKLYAICRRIAERGTRSLGNDEAQSIWVPLTDVERGSLAQVASLLSWSEGKMIAECLHDATVLAGSDLPITRAPVVASLFHAARLSIRQAEADLLAAINPVLERASQARQRDDERETPGVADIGERDFLPRVKDWLEEIGATKVEPPAGAGDKCIDLIATFPAGPFDYYKVGIWITKNVGKNDVLLKEFLSGAGDMKLGSAWVIYFGKLEPDFNLDAIRSEGSPELRFIDTHELSQLASDNRARKVQTVKSDSRP